MTAVRAQLDIKHISILVANLGDHIEKLCSAHVVLQCIDFDALLIADESMLPIVFKMDPLRHAHIDGGLRYQAVL